MSRSDPPTSPDARANAALNPAALDDAALGDAAWLRAALAWQIELGVDEAIGDAPIDRTKTVARRPQVEAAAVADPEADARALADAATDIAALKAALLGFEGSSLKAGARSTVFADGDPSADLMVVGEAPGREEDRQGLPFVGRSGQLLDRMLAAIGRDRRSDDPRRGAYITNVIPYRPLENRTPDDQEVRLLLAFARRHIELAAPKAVLCLGNVPAKHLMGAGAGITRYRGAWAELQLGGLRAPALATFHPAYLLRSPDMKRLAWRDLLSLSARLDAADASEGDPR